MLRNENLILSWASGDQFFDLESFWAFVRSACQVKNADLVICSHDIPPEARDRIEGLGAYVYEVSTNKVDYINRDRFLAYWDYLLDHGHKYKHVICSDSKDVLFQDNPFQWMELFKSRYDHISGNREFLNRFVVLVYEGMKLGQSGWNLIEQFEFQRDVPPKFVNENRDRWVVNSGVILGIPEAVKNLCLLLWSVQMKTVGRCTDQACLNYLFDFLKEDEAICWTHPVNDFLCATGEAIKEGFVSVENKDGELWNVKLNRPYCIIHQWDRLEFKDEILARHSG